MNVGTLLPVQQEVAREEQYGVCKHSAAWHGFVCGVDVPWMPPFNESCIGFLSRRCKSLEMGRCGIIYLPC